LKNIIGFNIVGVNIVWFGLVYWGNTFIPVAFGFILTHLIFSLKGYKELFLILLISIIGIYVDTVLQYLNFFSFTDPIHIPNWLMVLWVCFATILSHSLRFLGNSTIFQLFASFLAPLSYIAGYKFEAVNFGYSLITTYCTLALVWFFLFLLFFKLQQIFIEDEVKHA
jgi:hypothetical protein